MKKYLRLLCMSVLVGAVLVITNLPTQATSNLAEDAVRWLQAGESFQVAAYFFEAETIGARCNQDCYDLDLALYEPQTEKRIAIDDDGSSEPGIQVPYEGEFVLKVEMKNCARDGGCRAWVEWPE